MEFIQNGDIFKSNCDLLVNPVNTVGVSGKGLALEFKKKFPKSQKSYEIHCREGILFPGTIQIISKDGWSLSSFPLICYFPTKRDWREPSRMEDIHDGLISLRQWLIDFQFTRGIKSVAIPALGSGLGGLPWEKVKLDIIQVFDVDYFGKGLFRIYEPLS
jgi:O-acetyl-ADP-ribose deacetylase (regulator of RNase III)